MFENLTIRELLVWLLSAGTLAVLLERIPGWHNWTSKWKVLIVGFVGIVAPFLLNGVLGVIPPDVQNVTAFNFIVGLFVAGLTFVFHKVDEWLSAKVEGKKLDVFQTAYFVFGDCACGEEADAE